MQNDISQQVQDKVTAALNFVNIVIQHLHPQISHVGIEKSPEEYILHLFDGAEKPITFRFELNMFEDMSAEDIAGSIIIAHYDLGASAN